MGGIALVYVRNDYNFREEWTILGKGYQENFVCVCVGNSCACTQSRSVANIWYSLMAVHLIP